MKDDPAISRIRETRHQISEKFGHNAEKIVNHYIALQKRHKKRLINAKPKKKMRVAT